MNDTPYTTIGDEPVEARIVAWVLGEASGFEVAELERLCEERPELLVFRRRMRALHGLLTEAEAAQADDFWKLPPEKRRALDEICGEEPPRSADPLIEKRIRRSGRRALLAIAACLLLTFIVAGLLGPATMSLKKAGKPQPSAKSVNFMPRAEPAEHDGDRAMQELAKIVRDQEDKVEDRRKVLSTIERTKASRSEDSHREEAIKRGLDAQDYADAKRDYESDLELLQSMKIKQMEEKLARKLSSDKTPASGMSPLGMQMAEASGVPSPATSSGTGKLAQGELLPTTDGAPLVTQPSPDSSERTSSPIRPRLVPAEPGGKPAPVVAAAEPAATTAPLAKNEEAAPLSQQKKRNLSGPVAGKLAAPADTTSSVRSRAVAAEENRTLEALGEMAKADPFADKQGVTELKRQKEDVASHGLRSSERSISGTGMSPPVGGAASGPASPSAPAPAARPKQAEELAAKDQVGRDVLDRPQPEPESKPAAAAPAKAGSVGGSGGGRGAAALDANSSLALGLGDDATPAPPGEYELHTGYSSEYLYRGVNPDRQGGVTGNLPQRAAGEKSSPAEKQARAAQLPPVRGALIDRRDQREMDERRDSNGRDGDGTAEGKSTVAGDTSNVTGAGSLDGAVRSNPSLTFEQNQNVDKVRRNLYTADGNYNLGKFDDAKREYESTLRLDPYNAAARKGLEKIAAAKSDYYRAAYDQTRAELLSQADAAWELTLPADEKNKDTGAKFNFEGTNEYHFKGGKELGQSKAASDSKAKAPQLEIIREFTYPTEYEPPETPQGNKPSADSAALRKAIQDQEQKVEERRKVLSTIVRTKGIIYKGTDSFYGQSGVDQDQGARDALQTFHELEQEKMQLDSQIKSLLKYDSDQLMVYAGGLDLPENTIKTLYPEYQEAKRKLEGLKINGLGDGHPTVRAEKNRIDAMKRQLDEGVVNLRATLKAQLDMTENRLKSVNEQNKSTREEAIKRGLDAQDYVDAKKEFEKEQQLLQQLKVKLMAAAAAPVPEPPKPDLTKLIEETAAAAEPYSTFSLNISDASFQVAQAALAKGQRPDPAGIKVEQFYNAVDYGDPAPTAGEPVAVAIEQAAHPVIPGRNLVRVALKTAAEGRSAAQPLRLTLLVDQSGSMVREDRHLAMDKALAGLAGLLTKNDLVTVIGFARTPRLLADGWTGDKAAKLTELVNQSASEGGTNLEEALKLAEQLAERRKLAGAQNRIVLFTDGAANLGDADPTRLAAKVKALRQKGIAFDIAGIAADELNDELLGDLARNGNGRYYVVGKGADEEFARKLAGAFRPAAENVKVQVHFNPERVGRYKLIGFEKDRLKTEDFRNDAVDAAELAAEEAGVAVYQVEPLPGGSGEIGDVSVRFRDAASGQMVERTWTIPHDAGAPAIDRATPPMQLAVLAMLAAEKLRGGPLAEAIDFKQLAEPRANVKRFYGNTGRVAEVLHMINSL